MMMVEQPALPDDDEDAGASIGPMLQRYAQLAAGEQALLELLALSPHALTAEELASALVVVAPEPEWRDANSGIVARALLRLREFVRTPRLRQFMLRDDDALRHATGTTLVDSGRAQRIAAHAAAAPAAQLERLEPPYENRLRLALGSVLVLAGAAPPQLPLGATRAFNLDRIKLLVANALRVVAPAEHRLLDGIHPVLLSYATAQQLGIALLQPRAGTAALYAYARGLLGSDPRRDAELLPLLFEHGTLRGDLDWVARVPDAYAYDRDGYLAVRDVFDGTPPAAALPTFDHALKTMREEYRTRTPLLGMPLKLHLACLTVSDDVAQSRRRDQFVNLRDSQLPSATGGLAFDWWQQFMLAQRAGQLFAEPQNVPADARADDLWWLGVLLRWSGAAPSAELHAALVQAHADAVQAEWRWLAAQIAAVLDLPDGAAAQPPVHAWLAPKPEWQTALDALAQALHDTGRSAKAGDAGASQLQVRIDIGEGPQTRLRITVSEQRPKANGWTSGRVLNTTTLMRGALDRLPPGDDPDRQLLSTMLAAQNEVAYYGIPASSRTVAALIGHPRVAAEDAPDQPLLVEGGEIELQTTRLADGRIRLQLDPPAAGGGDAFVCRQGPYLRLYRPDPGLKRIAEIVRDGLALPAEAIAPLLQLLPSLARRVKLSADLAALGVEDVTSDPRLHALLQPAGQGLAVRIVVRPLGAEALFPPGAGPVHVLGGGRRPQRAQRDLDAERRAYAALQDACPALTDLPAGDTREIADPEIALGLLELLQAQPDVILEWRDGRALRVARTAEQPLQLQVAAQRDWFAAEGGLRLDDGHVVALAQLLRALPSAQGRYLRLDDDRVVALSAELRRRLQALRAFADDRGRVHVPKHAAFALEAALDDDDARDEAFRQQLSMMEAAQSLQPALPANFQAELRDYQIDGYRFMLRLAAWGAGACLADDMGLGKTVQALAVLCARAAEGPALVVAPTSVIGNWQREAQRFAPDLVLRRYGDGDRAQALHDLGADDVVLVSYGLLTANIDAFAEIGFATLVLDEAQAFKNAATQRAQAVRRLQAKFRIATTGTPLENHLGELWSLFRVLNPGLLGSEEQFRRRFIAPLERDPRSPQRDLLRRLLGPFLLRRTKAQVLTELPPRTEIVLTVEPSREEAQLLAALRRQAVDRLKSESMPTEQRRVHVLAELTRLRRAACHPVLAAPELGLASSKLEQLVELVVELADNRHRALVFSQFVDYLQLVRERLDREGIAYQYLDGSTPTKAREAAVQAFQHGEGTVFLLSLKAGGVGLNLTAADYVIHLDPWWNPAVEQQASDRAHRIGQTRPVTVYKLVLEGSIEEQILALHGSKRELVDQVIGDQAGAAALSVEELIGLLGD